MVHCTAVGNQALEYGYDDAVPQRPGTLMSLTML